MCDHFKLAVRNSLQKNPELLVRLNEKGFEDIKDYFILYINIYNFICDGNLSKWIRHVLQSYPEYKMIQTILNKLLLHKMLLQSYIILYIL